MLDIMPAEIPSLGSARALFGVSNTPPSGSGALFCAPSNPSTFGKSNCGPFESSATPIPSTFGATTCPFDATPSFSWPSSTSTFGSVTTPALVGTSVSFGGVSEAPLSGPPITSALD